MAKNIKLSVIVPVFNESATIQSILKSLLKIKEVDEVIVVNDCSTDDTAAILDSFPKRQVRVVTHNENLGKGAAITTGLNYVTEEYVLIQDADLEYDPEDIPALLAPIKKERAQVVYGSRFTGPRKNMFFWHMLGNRFLTFMVNILFNTTLSDMETCYKILPTKLFLSLGIISTDFTIEPEITCKLLKKGYFIYEVPISYTGRTFEEGKKITWIDGVKALGTILAIRLSSSKI